jgi:hypothetical protein
MAIKIRNLDYIRAAKEWTPELGGRVYEALQDFNTAISNHLSQTNSNATGEPEPPPAPMGIQVATRDGYMSVALNDQGPLYRGVKYWVHHASTPNFTDAVHTQASGTEIRNHTEFIGNQTRYVRAYKSYAASGPTTPVVHGGVTPIAVQGGGSIAGPIFLAPQGTGTSSAGGAVSGPGITAFRNAAARPVTPGITTFRNSAAKPPVR